MTTVGQTRLEIERMRGDLNETYGIPRCVDRVDVEKMFYFTRDPSSVMF